MIKKIGVTLFALFVVEVAGCNWFWNQKPVCDEKSPTHEDCKYMPPLPPMAVAPEAGTDAASDGG